LIAKNVGLVAKNVKNVNMVDDIIIALNAGLVVVNTVGTNIIAKNVERGFVSTNNGNIVVKIAANKNANVNLLPIQHQLRDREFYLPKIIKI
jgi:hypothetical protein